MFTPARSVGPASPIIKTTLVCRALVGQRVLRRRLTPIAAKVKNKCFTTRCGPCRPVVMAAAAPCFAKKAEETWRLRFGGTPGPREDFHRGICQVGADAQIHFPKNPQVLSGCGKLAKLRFLRITSGFTGWSKKGEVTFFRKTSGFIRFWIGCWCAEWRPSTGLRMNSSHAGFRKKHQVLSGSTR